MREPAWQVAQCAEQVTQWPADYAYFCRKLKGLTGLDLSAYKWAQMFRRLDSYRVRHGFCDFYALAVALEKDPAIVRSISDFITINVTEFFRNEEQWKLLSQRVIPALMSDRSRLRAWSAGCSAGQEAYSLAILLDELDIDGEVLATDIDEPSLKRAREGAYSDPEVAGIPKEILDAHFIYDGERYLVRSHIKRKLIFRRHDLLSDPYPDNMDLILCRNVLIYFTDKAKERVVRSFVSSLTPGGVLFTGSTEALFSPRNYGLEQIAPFLYRRVS